MKTQLDYADLINKTRLHSKAAYNELCDEFIGYVPLIIADCDPLIKDSGVDLDDLTQEGYLAVCEALHNIIYSDKEYTTVEISRIITSAVVLKITRLISSKINQDTHEESRILEYGESDYFKDYLTAIKDEETYQSAKKNIKFLISAPCENDERYEKAFRIAFPETLSEFYIRNERRIDSDVFMNLIADKLRMFNMYVPYYSIAEILFNK